MEVACGEYGDVVPKLVVAVKNGQCLPFQTQSAATKVINLDKAANDKSTNDVNYLLHDELIVGDKIVEFDQNLQSFVELKESMICQSCSSVEDDSLKNQKLSVECGSTTSSKQVIFLKFILHSELSVMQFTTAYQFSCL